jgi:hypothetical protein
MRVLLIAAALLPCLAAAATLEGTVVEDHSAKPLASVELRVARSGATQLTADLETDANGRFRAEGIPEADYAIEVLKPNFVSAKLQFRLSADSRPLVVRLVRYAVISGRVSDADGRSVPGAAIIVMTRKAGAAMQPFGYPARLRDAGEYRVFNLPPGAYAIAAAYGAAMAAVSSGGMGLPSTVGSGVLFYPNNQRPQWFTVAGGEEYPNTNFVIGATSLFRVAGRVEPAGQSYVVALTPVDQPLITAATQRLESRDGVFELEGIPPGAYDLYASGPVASYGAVTVGLGPEPLFGSTRVTVGGEDMRGLTVSAAKGRSAAFILRGSGGKTTAPEGCPATATLKLARIEATGAASDRTAEINFAKPQTLADIAPGRYNIALDGLGETCYAAEAAIDLNAPAEEPIPVTVTGAASVRGRLTGAAGQAGEYVVVLAPADASGGGQPVQSAYLEPGSQFSFAGLRPGRYRIGAQPAGAPRARWVADSGRMMEIDLPGGAPTDIDLPAPAGEAR